jgi:hypothetical protein
MGSNMAKMLPFIALVVGYIAFELYAVQKTKYRIDPVYIFDQFLSAHYAVRKCGNPENGQLQQFLRNLESVTARAANKLHERHPEKSTQEIDRMIAAQRTSREQEVEAIVKANGCSDPQITTLLKRFEIRARLRVG